MKNASKINETPPAHQNPVRVWRVLKWVTLVVVGTTLAFAAVILALAFHKSDPPNVATDPIAANKLANELSLAEATATVDAPQAVRVGEGALNSVLQSRFAPNQSNPGQDDSVTVRDARVKFIGDRMQLYVVLGIHGKDMTMNIEAQLHSEGGYMQVIPVSGRIGAIRVPQSGLRSAVAQMMATPENREQFRLPANLSDLRVEDGHLVVTFK